MNDDTITGDIETTAVEWRGRAFTVPANAEDWPAKAVEAFEAGHAITAVHAVLGEDQWERVHRVSRGTVREVGELFELLAQAAGFTDSGE